MASRSLPNEACVPIYRNSGGKLKELNAFPTCIWCLLGRCQASQQLAGEKPMLVVPAKECRRRLFARRLRHIGQPLTVMLVVLAAVSELLLDPGTHFNPQVVGHSDVPSVEERM